MRSERGFLYLHADSRGGAIFVIADTREAADAEYDGLFANGADAVGGACDENYLGEAVVYFPEDVGLPASDIDREDGLVIVAGPHTAGEWRLDHGMLVCPFEVCPTCSGWLVHVAVCAQSAWGFGGGACCEGSIGAEEFPLEIEWVPGNRRPVRFASGWKHLRFHDTAWSLIVSRAT